HRAESESGMWTDLQVIYTFELDLNTMIWTRTAIEDEIIGGALSRDMRLYCTRNTIYTFSFKTTISGGEHIIMDGTTGWCTTEREGTSQIPCTVFAFRDHVYKIGCVPKGKGHVLVVYQYQEHSSEWIKVHECPSRRVEMSLTDSFVKKSGSRAYVIGRKLIFPENKLDFVIVLELDPSLLEHSMAAIFRCEPMRKFAALSLPPHLAKLMGRDSKLCVHKDEEESNDQEFESLRASIARRGTLRNSYCEDSDECE
ncbi:hypothetical protein PMAYCL1PPCAC_20459, partial [Pristionchus mayeri]